MIWLICLPRSFWMNHGATKKAHQHGRDRGHDRAERRVAEHVQRTRPAELVTQGIEQLVDQPALPSLSMSPSTTRSARTPREAFTSTTSRGLRFWARNWTAP